MTQPPKDNPTPIKIIGILIKVLHEHENLKVGFTLPYWVIQLRQAEDQVIQSAA
jgi:hypothetical protein